MYVDTSTLTRDGKTSTRHLLRSSYRDGGKVKHTTLANLSHCSDEEIAALKLAFKHKKDLGSLGSLAELETTLGKRIGAVWTLWQLAERLGLRHALGHDRAGRLALLQVMARVIDQGSRLSAVRLAQRHALCEVLGLSSLCEDDLYANLAWLSEQQEHLEQSLFRARYGTSVPTLFLYDVTSSYLEGEQNALGAYGYNRDGKKGRKQIVMGLLTGPDGQPVAVRVFVGNTSDPKTVSEQVRILAESFGVREVTLVGDRGMLKGPQINALPEGFRYITALSKPQIRTLLTQGLLQLDLFQDTVGHVEQAGKRYVLRRNPVRAHDMQCTRLDKLRALTTLAQERTGYLQDHPKASAERALAKVQKKIIRLKAHPFAHARLCERSVTVHVDEDALQNAALLDGCYAIVSDVPAETADAQTLHDRYCDLEQVERDFRTLKTSHLDLRPVFVRTEHSTRGHAFVVMLALLVQRQLERCWKDLDLTVQEGLDELGAISMQRVSLKGLSLQSIPTPTLLGQQLLNAAHVQLPNALPIHTPRVHTKKKLRSERK